MSEDSKGVPWLEIIVAVAVVVLIVNIMVPAIWSKKTDINGGSAVRSLRMIVAAEQDYATHFEKGYTASLAVLGPPPDGTPYSTLVGYLDNELASGTKEGYTFVYMTGPPDSNGRIQSYTVNANPTKAGETGTVRYFVDQTGVIRQNPSRPATASDAPIAPIPLPTEPK